MVWRVWQRDGFEISDDPSRLDVDRIWRWLAEESYWAVGRPRDVVERSLAGSVSLGAYRTDGEQVAFCRWVTDQATFGWLCDVFVSPTVRGEGIGTWLVSVAIDHPSVRGLPRQLLATRDAHGLYARFGFETLPEPHRWMERRRAG
jgi:GNAT superfamily N-acetyltransferase